MISEALKQWQSGYGRRTPWRESDDVYVLAVAEILLQKTKGGDAAPIWEKVISTYPTAMALASANEGDIRDIVAGLGLGQQRAHRLKTMAQVLGAGEQT